tara:strand:+ start:61971 stop:62177 length:207 start_codon:yes stop_codon:yes gene_type:complete
MYEVLTAFGVYSVYEAVDKMRLQQAQDIKLPGTEYQINPLKDQFIPRTDYTSRMNIGKNYRKRGSKVR